MMQRATFHASIRDKLVNTGAKSIDANAESEAKSRSYF